ncbi:hypothetical protein D3C71_1304220 [compost metagenome]
MKHLEGVARAVADSQHDVVGLDMFAVGERHARDLAVLALHGFHFAGEPDFAAQFGDGVAHDFDHAHQAERADVRLADVQNFFRRAGQHKFLQDLFAVVLGVFDLAVQLAVRERARAAFAELHVRLGVQDALAPQAPGVLGAFTHCLAAFQDDGLEAHLRQHQAGEQATGAGADDDGALGQRGGRLGDELVFGVGRGLHMTVVMKTGKQRRFIFDVDIQRVGQQDIVLFARVVAAQKDGEAMQVASRNAQFLKNRGGQFFGRVVQRQLDFGQSQHASVQRVGDHNVAKRGIVLERSGRGVADSPPRGTCPRRFHRHPFPHHRRRQRDPFGRRQRRDPFKRVFPRMQRQIEGAVVDRQQPAAAQVQVGLQGFFGLHVHERPALIVGAGFHPCQVEGAVGVADGFETVEVTAVAAEEDAQVGVLDDPRGP